MRPALHRDLCPYSWLLLLFGLCKAGRAPFWRSNLKSATCLVQGGSRSFSEVEFEKCDLPWRVALFSDRQVSILFSDDLAEIWMQIGPVLKKCDLPCARRVALWGSGSEGPKMSKNGSSQNELLYSGKCSHTLGDYF